MKSFVFLIFVIGITFLKSYAQNQAPVAVQDSMTVMEQVPVLIDVKANDYDPDGDQIFIGTVLSYSGSASALDEMIYYKSIQGETGGDYFRYNIKDNQTIPLYSPFTDVNITLLPNPDIPVAVPDTFELMKLIPHNINLISNDYDLNGDNFKIFEITNTEYCTVTINQDSSSVTVIPDIHSLCSFKYVLKESNTVTNYFSHKVNVRIITTENPDMPVIMPDTAYATGGIPVVIPVLENDSDPQGEAIEIFNFTGAQDGSVTKSGENLIYTPDLSFTGLDQFSYNIREHIDQTIYTNSVYVKVFVSKNPHCPIGVVDNAEGTTYIPVTIDVLSNDYDVDADSLVIKDVKPWTSTISADNKIQYQSLPWTLGVDSIFYRTMEVENSSSFSEWTKVTIQLAVNPDLPVAVDDYATAHAGIPIEIKPLLNDIKNAEDTLILYNVSYGNKGIVNVTGDVVTYIPAPRTEGEEVLQYLLKNESGQMILAKGHIYINIEKQPYYDSIAVNNINAGVNADGLLFGSHFRYPVDSMTSTIFSSRLWLGGIDGQGEIHASMVTYPQEYIPFQSGPISSIYDTTHYLKFARIWKISKAEIEYHRLHYQVQGYQPIEAISTWPGNGNNALGQADQLAPYMDTNNDGLYNCLDGDYPLIRGDQTLYFMYNDDVIDTESDSPPLRAEIHAMIYGYNLPNDTALYNTVFAHFDIINRSTEIYHECRIGILTDPDIGYAEDDHIRCDVTRGSYYCYNGLEIDGNGQSLAYGENPPAQSVTVLAGPYKDPDGIDNPDGGCDESVNGLNFGNDIADDERIGLTTFNNLVRYDNIPIEPPPITESEYYEYMSNIINNGTRVQYGGGGHNTMGAVGPDCNFMFPGDSDPLNWGTNCVPPNNGYNQGSKFWTEEEAGIPYGDKKGLGSMGPFTFNPGQVQEIEIAYCVGQGNNGPGSSVNQLLRNIDSLINKTKLGNLIIPNNQLGITPVRLYETFGIYPNPAVTSIYLKGIAINQPAEYEIYSMIGNKVKTGICQPSSGTRIDIGFLPSGMYILRVNSGKEIFTGKFIKK